MQFSGPAVQHAIGQACQRLVWQLEKKEIAIHGLQYLVFMGVVSTAKRDTVLSVVALLGIATIGAVLLDMAKDAAAYMNSPYVLALSGAFYGATMAHFVLDAGIWRLREPFQRRYIRDRFSFVFDR